MKKLLRPLAMTACVSLLVGLFGCQGAKDATDEILTQKALSKDKTAVTVLVKNAFSINTFEKVVEEEFPQVDIVQVGNYTSNMGTAEYAARMKNDDLTDIVMTWPMDAGMEYAADRLVDLSSMPFSGKYATSMLDNISQEGKLYYLPGPSQVRGIVYNKTLFSEKGWAVPDSFDGFAKLCAEIEASGMRSLQLGLKNSEVLDTAFVGFGYEQSFSKPENAKWISAYDGGVGKFADNFTPALDTFQKLIDNNILQKGDLDIFYADRETMLFTRKCAMVEDSVLLTRMGFERNGCTDEFALMPFFNPTADSDWARLYPVCFIGVNKHLTEPANKEKYKIVTELMEYISTPEGQIALAGDTGAMFSCLNGTEPPDIPEIQDLLTTLSHGRYAVFPTLKNAQGALRTGLAGMVNGTMTAAQVAESVDKQNASPALKATVMVIGTAAEDFSLIETGNFITDAMRKEAGSDIALFLDNGKDGVSNGKGVSGRIYKGDFTALDASRILPDLRHGENGELWKVTMSGADLMKTLEYSITVDNDRAGWFYYFSGLKMTYDVTASPGERIMKITDDSGKAIDPAKIYSVAVMDETVPPSLLRSCEKTGVQISAIVENAISLTSISPSKDGRFTVGKK